MAKWHTVLRRRLEKKQLDAVGFNYCELCLRKVYPAIREGDKSFNTLTADHIIPKARGGANTIENLRIACFQCNQEKGCKLDSPFIINTNRKITTILDKLESES